MAVSMEVLQMTQAKAIIGERIDFWQAKSTEPGFNILRGMRKARADILQKLDEAKLPPHLAPVDATIGDIGPGSIKGELENDYLHLLGDLYLDPRQTEKHWEKEIEKQRIRTEYAEKGVYLTSYDSYARGTKESRQLFVQEAKEIGLDAQGADNAWLADGGMGSLVRIFRVLNWRYNKDHKKTPKLLAAVPSFTMTLRAAQREGFLTDKIDVSDLSRNELNSERLHRYFEEVGKDKIPDVFIVTPANNPTAMSYEPETLRGVINTMLSYNPQVQFVFDMAYMSMIPRDKARAIMQVLKETGVDKKSLFAFSESKVLARPGARIGAIMTLDLGFKENAANELEKPLAQSIDDDTMDSYPGFPGELDVEFQAIRNLVNRNPETLEKYFSLLRQRQQALLEALREVGTDFFENLDQISIPGYEKLRPDAVDQDVPLYLWLKVKPNTNPFEIIKKLNIVGAPSQAFGMGNGFMRFSVGYSSTNELLGIAPQTLKRWSR